MITKIVNSIPKHFNDKNISGKIEGSNFDEKYYFYIIKSNKSEFKSQKNIEEKQIKNEYINNENDNSMTNKSLVYIDESIGDVTPEQIESFQDIINKLSQATKEIYNPNDDAVTTALKLEDFFNIEDKQENEIIEVNRLYILHEIRERKAMFRLENKEDLYNFFEHFISKLYITGKTLDDYSYTYILSEYKLDKQVNYNKFVEYITSKIE